MLAEKHKMEAKTRIPPWKGKGERQESLEQRQPPRVKAQHRAGRAGHGCPASDFVYFGGVTPGMDLAPACLRVIVSAFPHAYTVEMY